MDILLVIVTAFAIWALFGETIDAVVGYIQEKTRTLAIQNDVLEDELLANDLAASKIKKED